MKNTILNVNDQVNVVTGMINPSPEFKWHLVEHGIDLEYDGRSELFILIWYGAYQYTEDHLTHGAAPYDNLLLRNLIVCRNPYKVENVNDMVVVAAPVIDIDYDVSATGTDLWCMG